jgi:hypothetical protein
VFLLILPRGDRCPICDAITVRVHSSGLRVFRLPLVKRWCLACGWEGLLRRSRVDESAPALLTASQPSKPRVEAPSRRR